MPKATILFADNDPDFLRARSEFLEQEGYLIVPARNPTEARRKLEMGGIDLAILDIRLEREDDEHDTSGLTLAKEVARTVPKIILTGFPSYGYVREALRPQFDGSAAAVDFLAKQEGPLVMLATVQEILKTTVPDKRAWTVFIAHGHDTTALWSVVSFVLQLGLRREILQEEPDQGDTIIEKLERCVKEADFAVVLLTPDDFGYSKRAGAAEVKPRARQNVIFELGYLLAKLGRRKVRALYQEGVEIPTNFAGVLYIPMDDTGGWKLKLAREMRATGIGIDLNRVA